MKKKIGIVILLLAILALTAKAFAGRGAGSGSWLSYSAPELRYPVTQDIDLSGHASLQFKWKQVDSARTDHYEFRLYKGYDMLESTLILKRDIPRDEYPFELPAENFALGQVYTWSLKQVYLSGVKSDRAYSPFKVIKK